MSSRMELYQTLSVIFLILALMFLTIAIVLFVVFDIYHVIQILSGRAAKKTILEMEKRNAQTGQLHRTDSSAAYTSEPVKKIEDVITYPTTESIGKSPGNAREQSPPDTSEQETMVLNIEPDQSYGRFVLIKDEILVHTSENIGGGT